MSADEMFEKLGYRKEIDYGVNTKYIDDSDFITITFDYSEQIVCASLKDTGKAAYLNIEELQAISEVLQAISKKCQELDWLDGKEN